MQRLFSLSLVLLCACDILTRVGDPSEEGEDIGSDTLLSGEAGTSTGGPEATVGSSSSTGGGTLGDVSSSTGVPSGTSGETSGASCPIDGELLENCPPPPEDWCEAEHRFDLPLPDGLAEYWETFCTPTEDAGAESGSSGEEPPRLCIIDGELLENCPPPPVDWCEVEDRAEFVLPDGLGEYWDTFCTPTEDSGAESGSSGEEPLWPCMIEGEWVEECLPPPVDWCEMEDRAEFVLPDGLGEYWDTFCTPAEDSGAESGSSGEEPPRPCMIEGEWIENCPPPPAEWCGLADGDIPQLPEGLAAFWDSYCESESETETSGE